MSNFSPKNTSLIYGPVPSRRLGRSLGVDIVPYKTCTYNCIYCQIGRSDQTTMVRRPYISADRILTELKEKLDSGISPDHITIGGSGEPCLNSEIGLIIKEIKAVTDIPVAVLTNGSLLIFPEVRQGLLSADVVLPSLDAYDEDSFSKINRPHRDVSYASMVRGLEIFRNLYTGQIWLEIFIIKGINDTREDMLAFRQPIAAIRPDRIHLNTAVRPPAENYAGQVSEEKLKALAAALGPRAEVVAEFSHTRQGPHGMAVVREIEEMISRRPCTARDIASGLGMDESEVKKQLASLAETGFVEIRRSGNAVYYFRPTAESQTD